MGNSSLPEVIVVSCVNKGDRVSTIVAIEPSINTKCFQHPPIAPATLTIYEGDKIVWAFELHKAIWREGNQIAFETYSHPVELPIEDKRYTFQSWWVIDQLASAQSRMDEWSKKSFVSPRPQWDHEHCRICWERISEYEDEQHFGYVRVGRLGKEEWLCEQCYEKYILSGFGKKLGDDIQMNYMP